MKYLIFSVLLGLGLAGCSQSAKEEAQGPGSDIAQLHTPTANAAPESFGEPQRVRSNVIYSGELDLAVDDFDRTSANLDDLLLEHHAYLSTAHETRANGQHRQEMTLKVKPEGFLPLVKALSKLGRIENKDISSADVTADVLATAAEVNQQVADQTKAEQQLTKATSPADRARLAETAQQQRAALAATQARLQQLSSRSAWATLTLRFCQTLPATEPSVPEPAFAPRFLEAFNRGWSFILEVLVVLTNVWPLLVIGGAATWLVRRWRLRSPARA